MPIGLKKWVYFDFIQSICVTPTVNSPIFRRRYILKYGSSYSINHHCFGSINQNTQSALRAFPNRGRSRYKQVIAVLIQWGDDASIVQPEIDRLRTIFEACYGFNTQLWLIPSSSSHLKLMSLVLHFLEDYGSSDNLMIGRYSMSSFSLSRVV